MATRSDPAGSVLQRLNILLAATSELGLKGWSWVGLLSHKLGHLVRSFRGSVAQHFS